MSLAVAIVSERLAKEVRLVTRRSGGHTWGNGSESSLRGILGIEGGLSSVTKMRYFVPKTFLYVNLVQQPVVTYTG